MNRKNMLYLFTYCVLLQSCATVFGGQITECQRHKPGPGEPRRKLRAVALTADILTEPVITLPIDFATGAIYKPCDGYYRGFRDQDYYSILGENEIYIGEGYASENQIRGWVGPPLLTNYISAPNLQTGAAFITYRHFVSERLAIGGTLGIDDEQGQLSYGNPERNAGGIDGVSGHYNVRAYSIAAEALMVYNKSKYTMTYGLLGAGLTSFNDKCVIFPNAPYGPPTALPSNPYNYNRMLYNFQFTPIGVRFGGKVAGFFELGYGYKGIVNGGISLRL